MWRDHRFVVLTLLLTAAVLWAQVTLFDWGVDAQSAGQSDPSNSASAAMVKRAEVLSGGGGFSNAFSDAQLMPGYPVYLSWFLGAFTHPWLSARFLQAFLAALTVPFAFLTLSVLLKSQGWALLGSIAFALWLPFYAESPHLATQSLSLFFYVAFCYQLARSRETQSHMHLLLMAVLAVQVYLDPLLALVFIPLAAVLEYRRGGGATGVTVLGPLLVLAALIFPWTAWISVSNQSFIPLTATTGQELYAGTGVESKVDTTRTDAAAMDLPGASAGSLRLSDPGLVLALKSEIAGLDAVAKDRVYRRAALSVWLKRPMKMVSYGTAKALHAFGFSFRQARDPLVVSLLVVSLLSSVFLWRRGRHREWCIFLWVAAGVVALHAFIFFPDQQFKTVLFDFPALLVVVLGAVELLGGGAVDAVSAPSRK